MTSDMLEKFWSSCAKGMNEEIETGWTVDTDYVHIRHGYDNSQIDDEDLQKSIEKCKKENSFIVVLLNDGSDPRNQAFMSTHWAILLVVCTDGAPTQAVLFDTLRNAGQSVIIY